MFTGIVQGKASIASVRDHDGIRTFQIEFPPSFCDGLAIGASVAVDGVCLTVTDILSPTRVSFDVIHQSLKITTLGDYLAGQDVNAERAAKDGAEIGGHPLSGHIDFSAIIENVMTVDGNKVMRFAVPPDFMRYIFAKGYIAINGTSLTVSDADRKNFWFEVWLIPETRRVTVFEQKQPGDKVNIEIERGTQVVVDTIRDTVRESLGRLEPVLREMLSEKNIDFDDLIEVPKLIRKT